MPPTPRILEVKLPGGLHVSQHCVRRLLPRHGQGPPGCGIQTPLPACPDRGQPDGVRTRSPWGPTVPTGALPPVTEPTDQGGRGRRTSISPGSSTLHRPRRRQTGTITETHRKLYNANIMSSLGGVVGARDCSHFATCSMSTRKTWITQPGCLTPDKSSVMSAYNNTPKVMDLQTPAERWGVVPEPAGS